MNAEQVRATSPWNWRSPRNDLIEAFFSNTLLNQPIDVKRKASSSKFVHAFFE